jgi:hypothetical protein
MTRNITIRASYAAGESATDLARLHGVSRARIYQILQSMYPGPGRPHVPLLADQVAFSGAAYRRAAVERVLRGDKPGVVWRAGGSGYASAYALGVAARRRRKKNLGSEEKWKQLVNTVIGLGVTTCSRI